MYQILKQNWARSKYFIISALFITSALLFTVLFKSDEKILKKTEIGDISNKLSETILFKELS